MLAPRNGSTLKAKPRPIEFDKQLSAHRERIEDELQHERRGDADDHLMNRDDDRGG